MLMWVKLYLIWNLFSAVRGLFIAETYWDWKALFGNSFALFVPVVAYTATNLSFFESILRASVKFLLPSFAVFVLLITNDAFGYYLVPLCFLALFLPIIPKPWNYIILALCVFVILADLSARSNVVKYAVPVALSSVYYVRFFATTKIMEGVRKLFIVAPFIFFFLAVSGVFNVFKIDEYVKGDFEETRIDTKGEKTEDDLKADTRSFLYLEVLQTAVKLDTWWIGRSPARGNLSSSFGEEDLNNRGERSSNEVGILNVFTWTGIVGVLLSMMVFYKASYTAVNRSNNFFSKLLGLFVAFRWLYSWVEDVNNFSITTVFLWFMIGLCFSESFRKMTDREVKIWVRGIFVKKEQMAQKIMYNHRVPKTI